ncbi:cytochrome P450 [Armillaria gallica]|uniref:Cytochrome P450 n=1 Tax=Armillaria gallica TaxID=47427 RepID=A0A2H3DK70_ARMGA|nr:cytochrome P450 [Armillaria gallica]
MTQILSEEVSPLWFLTAIVVVAYTTVRYLRSPWRNLPPGPRGLPLIGNLLELRGKQWLTFTELGRKYGDIMYFNLAGQPLVVLNSLKVAADLLDRRAGKFSDRPRNIVASDILTGGNMFPFAHYGEVWRRMRKAAHEGLNKAVVYRYHSIQTAEAVLLTAGVLAEPEKWDSHLRRTAASATMSVVYDTPPTSEQDPSIKNINDFVSRITRAAKPGAHFVTCIDDFLIRYAKWKREAEESYAKDSAMFEGLFNVVKDRVAKGDERPSLASTLIQDAGRHNLTEKENSWLAATMYAGGSDTSSATMSWWTLAMVVYPETQKRAQAELDAVVGRDRLPSFADYEHLPYIRAMIKEILRWCAIADIPDSDSRSLGIPHRSTEDDVYNGYFIPAGTILIANAWHLNRDPEMYGLDAEHFNPARHLDKDGKLDPGSAATKEESHVTYGFGRRICVGRHIANNTLFIDIAMMLWAMNIERATDENGVPLPLDVGGCVEEGLVNRPVPFKAKITPRFREAQAIVEQEQELLGYH